MLQKEQWNGFEGRLWKEEINVRDFVQNNYKPYDGDESFLEEDFQELQKKKEQSNKQKLLPALDI